jgi:hypothetical protein
VLPNSCGRLMPTGSKSALVLKRAGEARGSMRGQTHNNLTLSTLVVLHMMHTCTRFPDHTSACPTVLAFNMLPCLLLLLCLLLLQWQVSWCYLETSVQVRAGGKSVLCVVRGMQLAGCRTQPPRDTCSSCNGGSSLQQASEEALATRINTSGRVHLLCAAP